MSPEVEPGPADPGPATEELAGAADDHDRWGTLFYVFVITGIVVALVLGIREIVQRPVIDLSEVRSTRNEGEPVRAQVLARNASTTTTYCIEITFEALDRDGLSLESVVGAPTTGTNSLRPGQSVNFATTFTGLTDTEVAEELDDFLAFVTERVEC